MAWNNSEQEAATPTIAALKTSLEQQQSQINDLQTSCETQRKIFEDKVKQGSEANERLHQENVKLQEENEKLQQQLRDLMLTQKKNVEAK